MPLDRVKLATAPACELDATAARCGEAASIPRSYAPSRMVTAERSSNRALRAAIRPAQTRGPRPRARPTINETTKMATKM
jgi:hypothetical protein